MARRLAVHSGNALLNDKESGLTQRHGAAQLVAEELLVPFQESEPVFAQADRNDLMPGLLL